jgi:hypothetical protein
MPERRRGEPADALHEEQQDANEEKAEQHVKQQLPLVHLVPLVGMRSSAGVAASSRE